MFVCLFVCLSMYLCWPLCLVSNIGIDAARSDKLTVPPPHPRAALSFCPTDRQFL